MISITNSLILLSFIIQANSTFFKHSINYAYSKLLRNPLSYNSTQSSISIASNTIEMHPPQCNPDSTTENSTSITYRDCTVFSMLNLSVTVAPNYTFSLQNFYIEYNFPEIAYTLNQKTITPSISMYPPSEQSKGYSFNLNRAPLSSTYFKELVNMIDKAALNLTDQYKNALVGSFSEGSALESGQLETDLSSSYILLFYDSIVVDTKDDVVTYFSFLMPQTINVINLKEATTIGQMAVQFEYSIKYNLTYQEGSFNLLNFDFEKNLMNKEDPFKECQMNGFQPDTEDPYVKSFLFEKFKLWLIASIKKYYQLQQQQTSNDHEWFRSSNAEEDELVNELNV